MHNATDIILGGSGMGAGGRSTISRTLFPNVWADYAGSEMPRDLLTVLQWAEKLWYNNGIYRKALERVNRFFITKLQVSDVSDAERDRYVEILERNLRVYEKMIILDDDLAAYGNSFSSLYVPFKRFLICPKCGFSQPVDKVTNFTWVNFQFKGDCVGCHAKGVLYKVKDWRSNDLSKMRIIRWDPKHVLIQYNEVTQDAEYFMQISDDIKQKVNRGDRFIVSTLPLELIECVKQNCLFRFEQDRIFHMKDTVLAGLRTFGWGLPRFISVFRNVYHNQVLKRYNEALAMDYILPVRVVCPAGPVGSDPTSVPYDVLQSRVSAIFANHRRDPSAISFSPIPLQYMSMSGEGQSMATAEMINASTQELLDALGVPQELQRGTLSVQAAPLAIRLMEQAHIQIPVQNDLWLNWLVMELARAYNYEVPTVTMMKPMLADDMDYKQMLMQLAAAHEISKGTAYAPLGLDLKQELKRTFAEQDEQAAAEREHQRDEQERAKIEERLAELSQQQQAQGGGGGAPPPQGGPGGAQMQTAGPPGTPTPNGLQRPQSAQEINQRAEEMARQFLQMQQKERTQSLRALKQNDPDMHAIVTQKIRNLRTQAASIGQEQVLQQGGP